MQECQDMECSHLAKHPGKVLPKAVLEPGCVRGLASGVLSSR